MLSLIDFEFSIWKLKIDETNPSYHSVTDAYLNDQMVLNNGFLWLNIYITNQFVKYLLWPVVLVQHEKQTVMKVPARR